MPAHGGVDAVGADQDVGLEYFAAMGNDLDVFWRNFYGLDGRIQSHNTRRHAAEERVMQVRAVDERAARELARIVERAIVA